MEIVDAIDLPAGEEVAFRPGETHLMLVVPDETVRVGGTLELVLDFERSDDVTVDVAVVELTRAVRDDASRPSQLADRRGELLPSSPAPGDPRTLGGRPDLP